MKLNIHPTFFMIDMNYCAIVNVVKQKEKVWKLKVVANQDALRITGKSNCSNLNQNLINDINLMYIEFPNPSLKRL